MKFFLNTLSLLSLIFTLFSRVGVCQTFQHISEKNGAPGSIVYSASQDPMGFMWFATTDGVFKYDAHSFKYFSHNAKDSTSLASNYTTSVLSDPSGNVWVCTTEGLCRYNSKSETFQTFKPNRNDPFAISSNSVLCTAEDKQKRVWIGTAGGLDRVDIENGRTKFTHFLQAKRGEPVSAVQGIVSGENQELWLATSNGLVFFDNGKAQRFKANSDQRLPLINDFTHVFYDQAGNIWLGIRKGGLMRFNISSQKFELISGFKGKEGEWPDLSGFASDKPGKVWIATMSGLANFDLHTHHVEWYFHDPTNDRSPADDVMMSIFKDRQGGLWIGSYFGGVDYVSTAAPAFSRWPFFVDRISKNTFNGSWMGITPDQKNWLLAGDKSKIQFYDRVTNQVTTFNLNMEFVRNANHFFVDEHDILWCGEAGNLYAYDIKKRIRKAYRMPDLGRVPVEKNDLFIIIQDKHQQLWLGGMAGLLSFDKLTTSFQDISNDKAVSCLFEDSRGNHWFGGRNFVGILRDGKSEPEKILLKKAETPDDHIRSSTFRFCEDGKGRIWLASAMGLKVYNPKNRQFWLLSNNFKDLVTGVGDVQADRMGYLWIKGGGGLIRFHPDQGTIQLYNELDGLPKKAVLTLRGSMKDDKGLLFFNTNQEMFSFDPEKVSTNIRPERIVISSLRLFNKTVKANDATGILQEEISRQKGLVFTHDQNIFTLDFALLSYIRSHENKYKYRLEGFDKEWIEGKTSSATYMNLPSGKYCFIVYATNGDGLRIKEPLRLKIVILDPWWKTWFAYLFYILVIALAVYAVTRFLWIRSSFRQETALNQMKLDFFTNVSHEIRTHLSLISGPLEKAFQESVENIPVKNYLTYARSNSDRLMLLVNELLDFRKIQSGTSRLHVHEHDVVKIIKSVIAAFEHTAREKDIETTMSFPDGPVLLWFDIAQMQKVFYNLLSNAYKFTPNGGEVSVRVSEISNEVRISVADNGKGMSEEYLKKLFTYFYQADSNKPGFGIGLALSKGIVEQHHGYLTAESRPERPSSPGGTVMTIRLLRENRHFSVDEIGSKNGVLAGNMFAETVELKTMTSVAQPVQSDTILIIEDNDELRAFITELFDGRFYILEAESGERGLELANEHLPDIILSDVMMPGINGIEVCDRLKRAVATAHIPVVLLTARAQSGQVVEGLESGADDYIAKPFDPRVLELKINNLLKLRDDQKAHYRKTVLDGPGTEGVMALDRNEIFIAKVRNLVTKHISDPGFGVNELSVQIGVSVSVLYRKMRSLTGMTINEFVKTIRMNEAKKLLESGIYNVNEVSVMIGFEDSKYFSKEFRKVFSKTPNEVKKNGTG